MGVPSCRDYRDRAQGTHLPLGLPNESPSFASCPGPFVSGPLCLWAPLSLAPCLWPLVSGPALSGRALLCPVLFGVRQNFPVWVESGLTEPDDTGMNVSSAISGSSVNLTGSSLQNAISVRVARTSLDNAQSQGDAMVKMIDTARPSRAAISAKPTPTETGRGLDVTG